MTWLNNGPSAHTATADDGSFNTGVLPKGHSASHTFTKAGTFTYICSIHPFMHGTVVVLANTTSTTTTPVDDGSSYDHARVDHTRLDHTHADVDQHRRPAADDRLRGHRDRAGRAADGRRRARAPP